MALMDLCGISNLTWDSNSRYSVLPTLEGELESGHQQSNRKQPEIETQKAPLINRESLIHWRMQTDWLEHPPQTKNRKSVLPSTLAPPRNSA
jgi:hypothetical protein